MRCDSEIEIPHCDLEGNFFDSLGNFGPCPRTLACDAPEIDEDAVFSVLQFGAVIPPMSPFKNVRRALPGYHYRGPVLQEPITLPECELRHKAFDDHVLADVIETVLDDVIVEAVGSEREPLLLFSGGVDSGLIASRLVRLGYSGAILVHYSFGPDDAESKVAREMASALGLRFERIERNPGNMECLKSPGTLFKQPFGDHSVAPTAELASAVVKAMHGTRRIILDGTGADGLFGMGRRIRQWGTIAGLPKLPKAAAAYIYERLLWRSNGRLELGCRVLARSYRMPFPAAMVAQNALAGILYRDDARKRVDTMLTQWVSGWTGENPVRQAVAADVALTCSNIFAQKGKPTLEAAGHQVFYPFLNSRFLSLGLAATSDRPDSAPKSALKQSLARHVPSDLVYRRKSGFVDPALSMFYNPAFCESLHAAAEAGPISMMLHPEAVRAAAEMLMRGRRLPSQTLNCLWSTVFTDRWYRTVEVTASPANAH